MDYITWLKAHERIVIVAMVLLAGSFGLNKWLDKSAMDAASKAAVAQQVAAVQREADQKIATAVAQQTALFNRERQALEQEKASLVAAMASRDAASNKKIADVVAVKPVGDVLTDLAAAYPQIEFDPTEVTPSGKLAFTLPVVQQFTVAAIEKDTAEANLTDTKAELASTEALLNSANDLIASQKTQVDGLVKEIATDNAASKAELASVKASARKSKLKWFKAGVIVGFVGGLIVGRYIP